MLGDPHSVEAIVVIVSATVGALWGVPAVLGWRQVADARKERIAEIESAQSRAEEQIVLLNKKIAELEGRPNLETLQAEVRARHAEVLGCVREVKETLDAFIAERRG